MKTPRIGTIVAVFSLVALPARAADIGLVGGEFDPEPISNPGVFGFGNCSDAPSFGLPSNFRCVFYEFPDLDGDEFLDSISSIEFFLNGLDDFDLFVNTELSDLDGFSSGVAVPGALRLFTTNGNINPNSFCFESPDPECTPGLAFFVGPSSDTETLPDNQVISLQVVAVSGTVTAVPEPATLSMLGPGLLAVLFFRRRARSGRRT